MHVQYGGVLSPDIIERKLPQQYRRLISYLTPEEITQCIEMKGIMCVQNQDVCMSFKYNLFFDEQKAIEFAKPRMQQNDKISLEDTTNEEFAEAFGDLFSLDEEI